MISENGLIMEQRQVLSSRQVQSLDILSYTNQELEEFLTNEYLENPLLECTQDKESDMLTNIEKMYEKGVSYEEHYTTWQEDDSDRRFDIADHQDRERSQFLLGQLDRKDHTDQEWKIMEMLIECLDDDGFFPYTAQETARLFHVPTQIVETCLHTLKELEPTGVFSSDLSECLIRQAREKGICDDKLILLLTDYFPDIMSGHIGNVSRSLRLSTVGVKEYIHLISTLNPRPFAHTAQRKTEYIVPDILIQRHGDKWEITLNDQWMGDYRYNDYYLKMMEQAKDPELVSYFRERMERAKFVIQCVEQRRNTILRIVRAILEIQKDHFENRGPLIPMTLEDVAARTEFHPSTISRAVRNKYIQYHQSVLLKNLFSSPAAEKDNASLSAEQIKGRIKELIQGEKPEKPLSDARIADLLAMEGTDISRRTVAKYRAQLGILDSKQRMYYK